MLLTEVWNIAPGIELGHENIKSQVHLFLEQEQTYQNFPNPIPMELVDQTIDLILEYMKNTHQYGIFIVQ